MLVEIVSIPVEDQDRAIGFYRDALGFQLVRDSPFGEGMRWVELRSSPYSQTSISLVTWFEEMPPGSAQGLILRVGDIEAKRAELLERGVGVEEIYETPWGRFANFRDPDGNGWALRQ